MNDLRPYAWEDRPESPRWEALRDGVWRTVTHKEYTAEAYLLVTPVSQTDPAFAGLNLIRSSSDPTRDVETAAKLIVNRDVAL